LKAARSALGAVAVVVLAGGGLGSVGFSFDTPPGAAFRMDRSLADRLPKPVAPTAPSVKGIGAYSDPVIRAKSYFDTGTGQLCHGTGADRTCR
jgi:hypothetical protein